ncbi:hypothetical protein RAS1_40820 [Phycisphaerae bacterium RAS1]|nr:hypothetical protein RAS1_40820 [Phycisphaerae bacterium RAS1]
MSVAKRVLPGVAAAGLAFALQAGGGCTDTTLFLNQTAERTGNVTLQFVNNTGFRAAFTFGSFDSLDRINPGVVQLQQLRVEANTSSAAVNLTCRRNIALATKEFVDRVIETDTDNSTANFDRDAFGEVVNFSDAPANSEFASQPTAGTAKGREVLLGVDYSCNDRLIFTFEADPSAPGGFRIDFVAILDEDEPDR